SWASWKPCPGSAARGRTGRPSCTASCRSASTPTWANAGHCRSEGPRRAGGGAVRPAQAVMEAGAVELLAVAGGGGGGGNGGGGGGGDGGMGGRGGRGGRGPQDGVQHEAARQQRGGGHGQQRPALHASPPCVGNRRVLRRPRRERALPARGPTSATRRRGKAA